MKLAAGRRRRVSAAAVLAMGEESASSFLLVCSGVELITSLFPPCLMQSMGQIVGGLFYRLLRPVFRAINMIKLIILKITLIAYCYTLALLAHNDVMKLL